MRTKKWMAVILTGLVICGITGCGSRNKATEQTAVPEIEGTITLLEGKWDDVYFNEEYQEEGMKTVKGVEDPADTSLIAEEAGGGLLLPESWQNCSVYYDYFIPAENQVEFLVFRTEDVQKLDGMENAIYEGTATFDDFRDAFFAAVDASFHIFGIYSTNAADLAGNALFSDSDFGTKFAYAEKIGTYAGQDYYFVYNDMVPADSFSVEAAEIQILLDSMEEVRENLFLFTPHEHDYEAERKQNKERASSIDLSDFEVTDLNGNTVTQDIFKDYDITMINIWATWCGPCRSELSEIQAAYEQLPKNANIISICHDAAEETEVANAIVHKTGVEFSVLIADEKMEETVFSHIAAFPTTIFVDSEGHLVGDVQIGVPSSDDVTQVYLDLIGSALGQ